MGAVPRQEPAQLDSGGLLLARPGLVLTQRHLRLLVLERRRRRSSDFHQPSADSRPFSLIKICSRGRIKMPFSSPTAGFRRAPPAGLQRAERIVSKKAPHGRKTHQFKWGPSDFRLEINGWHVCILDISGKRH